MHEAFDAEHSLALLTKEMVLATIFGVDMALLRDPRSEGHHVVDWIEVVFNVSSLSPFLVPPLPRGGHTLKRPMISFYHSSYILEPLSHPCRYDH
jgi:hypothetical protein